MFASGEGPRRRSARQTAVSFFTPSAPMAELLQRTLEAWQHSEHADRSGDGRGLGVNEVRGSRDPQYPPDAATCPSTRTTGIPLALASIMGLTNALRRQHRSAGLSTRTTSALMPSLLTPVAISLAMVFRRRSPAGFPIDDHPAMVTTPIGPVCLRSTTSDT